MAQDLYSYLIGGGASTADQQKAVVDQLRRRRAFGELGAASGDRVLQSFGQNLAKGADDYAGNLQQIRQQDADNAQTAAYQSGQLSHMGNVLEETKRGNTLDFIAAMAMADAARMRAENSGQTKVGKLTYADRTKLENLSNMISQSRGVEESFLDDYTQRFGPGPQSKLSNTLSSLGLNTEGGDKAANWWAQWNLLYTLPQRNATFGATLTPGEKQSWYESDITPSMSAKQVRERVRKITRILAKKGALINHTYQSQFGEEAISPYGLPTEQDIPEDLAMATQQQAAPVAPQAPVQAPVGAAPPQGGLSPEELQELQALRAKYGRTR